MSSSCLCCHRKTSGEIYHAACLKNLFGSAQVPRVSFSIPDIPVTLRETSEKISPISGVQIKAFVKRNPQTRELVIAPSGGTHVLKPDPPQYPELSINENVCMAMASELGMEVPPHGLFPMPDGMLCYVVLRFDREPDGRKIHKEDLAQILGVPADSKYLSSLEAIGRAIWKHTAVPGLETLRFFERVLLCYVIGNGDMHLKNWSLLRPADGRVRLTPCYDLVSSEVYFRDEESALSLNGKKNRLKRQDFEALATYLKIDPKAASKVFQAFEAKHQALIEMVLGSPLSFPRKEKLTETMRTHLGVLSKPS